MKIRGKVTLRVLDSLNRLVKEIEEENLVVQTGMNNFAAIIQTNNGTVVAPTHLACGTDETSPTAAQTALVAESAVLSRAALSIARVNNVLTYTATVAAGASNVSIKEMGLFNAAVAGTMYARFLPTEFVLEVGGSVLVSWALTFGD